MSHPGNTAALYARNAPSKIYFLGVGKKDEIKKKKKKSSELNPFGQVA